MTPPSFTCPSAVHPAGSVIVCSPGGAFLPHHSATGHELRRSATLYTNTDSENAGGISGVTGA